MTKIKQRIKHKYFPGLALSVICLLVGLQTTRAQSGKVIVSLRETTVKQAMDDLQRQTDYKVAVNWEDLDPGKKVFFPIHELEIVEMLRIALAGTGFTWELKGEQIIITHIAHVKSDDDKSAHSAINGALKSTEMVFIPDPWSRTQKPFEGMFDTGKILWNEEEGEGAPGMAVINYRVNSSTVEKDYMENARTLAMIHKALTSRRVLAGLDRIVVTAASSPEGSAALNEKLAAQRVLAMKSYLMWQYPFLDRDIIYTFSAGENWSGLRKMVDEDRRMPYRDEVLRVLDSDVSTEYQKSALKRIGNGVAYRYISTHMLPKLRGAAAATLHLKEDFGKVIERIDTVYIEKIKEIVVEKEVAVAEEPELESHPLFAIKTNLLFDLFSALNVEIEIPIGKRWSVAGEWVFPWWLYKKKQIALQVGNGNLEIKYWLGNRDDRRQLTGWFVGLYGGGGYYDLEWKTKGYQGEFWHGGVSGGYAHTISKNGNWRMEYTLGVGYMKTKYRKYVPKFGPDDEWHLIRQGTGRRSWVGPTRAKVSLVWMINHGFRKKGGVK